MSETAQIRARQIQPKTTEQLAIEADAARPCHRCGVPRSEHIEVLSPTVEERWVADPLRPNTGEMITEQQTVIICPRNVFAAEAEYSAKARKTNAAALSR